MRVTLKRLWVVVCLLGLQEGVFSSTVERYSWERLLSRSEAIFRGQCVAADSYRDAATGIIWTRYHFLVSESFKGSHQSEWTVTEPGGLVAGIGQVVTGVPRFSVGDEAILFVYATERGKWRVRGLGQGYFQILPDSVPGLKIRQSLAGLDFVDGRNGDAAALRSPLQESNLELFLQHLRRGVR